ncbi:hypothetical protein BGW38_010618 [Lunasporangiospora selenospora]|uniref:Nuclear speckle splicing regulatory protein 1 N-terminal domain-containing protein n=1 Tax=Lunasporangiospora selenospora TaxID=979761 RepID=A0A9P6FY74_9FUNG|nr:hypothetical protein BGW38_010618 [Lunasporangiospora selenospora]
MSGLQFGLNVRKKTTGATFGKPGANARPMGRTNAFGDRSSDEDDLDEDRPSSSSSSSSSRRPPNSTAVVNKTLRSYATSTVQAQNVVDQQNEALAQDATIFDYDGVYDQLKAGDRAKEIARKKDAEERKPKYVLALLQAAETRKRDRQVAEERRIERERELEGEEFKDKEMFITPAYKAQKEAMRLAEEEEKRRDEAVAKDEDGSMMRGFYRTMLDERTKLRPDIVVDESSATSASKNTAGSMDEEQRAKVEEERRQIIDARERGIHIAINDDGEVIDKRELLKGGLNITKKPGAPKTGSSSSSRSGYDRNKIYSEYKEAKYKSSSGRRDDHQDNTSTDQRARMTEQIEKQLMEQEKKREEEEKERQESIRQALKRKNQDDQVMDAKARYLARKAAGKSDS